MPDFGIFDTLKHQHTPLCNINLYGSKVWTKNEEKPCLKTHLLADSGYYTRNPISGNPPLVITIILSCWNQLLLHLSLRIGIYQMYNSTRIMLNYNTAQLIWLLCCHIPYNFIFCLMNHRIEKRERDRFDLEWRCENLN